MTLTPSRAQQRIGTLALRLSRASHIVPDILRGLDDDRAHIGTRTIDETGRRATGAYSDPTARQAAELEAIDNLATELANSIALCEASVDDLNYRIRKANRTADTEPPTCHGGDPSTWGDPECNQLIGHRTSDRGQILPDRDGLCDDHRRAKETWERRQRRLRTEPPARG